LLLDGSRANLMVLGPGRTVSTARRCHCRCHLFARAASMSRLSKARVPCENGFESSMGRVKDKGGVPGSALPCRGAQQRSGRE
jgi:hypothetical protein